MLDLEKSSFEHSTRKHVKSFSSGASSVQGAEGKQKKKKQDRYGLCPHGNLKWLGWLRPLPADI